MGWTQRPFRGPAHDLDPHTWQAWPASTDLSPSRDWKAFGAACPRWPQARFGTTGRVRRWAPCARLGRGRPRRARPRRQRPEVRRVEAEGFHRFETDAGGSGPGRVALLGLGTCLGQTPRGLRPGLVGRAGEAVDLVRDRMGVVPLIGTKRRKGRSCLPRVARPAGVRSGAPTVEHRCPGRPNHAWHGPRAQHGGGGGSATGPRRIVGGPRRGRARSRVVGPGGRGAGGGRHASRCATHPPQRGDVGRGVTPTSNAVGGGHVAERIVGQQHLGRPRRRGVARPVEHVQLGVGLARAGRHRAGPRGGPPRGSTHHEIRITARTWKALPGFLDAMDMPVAHGFRAHVAQSMLRQAGVEVALGELGGDSMFAGDPIFQRSAQLAKLNWLASWPGVLRRLVGRLHVTSKPGFEARKTAELLGGHHFDLAHTHPIAETALPQGRFGAPVGQRRAQAPRRVSIVGAGIGAGTEVVWPACS